jgi:hypothetical protein
MRDGLSGSAPRGVALRAALPRLATATLLRHSWLSLSLAWNEIAMLARQERCCTRLASRRSPCPDPTAKAGFAVGPNSSSNSLLPLATRASWQADWQTCRILQGGTANPRSATWCMSVRLPALVRMHRQAQQTCLSLKQANFKRSSLAVKDTHAKISQAGIRPLPFLCAATRAEFLYLKAWDGPPSSSYPSLSPCFPFPRLASHALSRRVPSEQRRAMPCHAPPFPPSFCMNFCPP